MRTRYGRERLFLLAKPREAGAQPYRERTYATDRVLRAACYTLSETEKREVYGIRRTGGLLLVITGQEGPAPGDCLRPATALREAYLVRTVCRYPGHTEAVAERATEDGEGQPCDG